MPTWNNSADDVTQKIKEKQMLEVSLAWDLLEIFNESKSLIGFYRAAVETALAEMISASYEDKEMKKITPAGKSVQAAIAKEKPLIKVLSRFMPGTVPQELTGDKLLATNPRATKTADVKEPKDLVNLHADVGTFDSQDCSDIIRLYGTFVELAGKDGVEAIVESGTIKYAELEKARKAPQKGVTQDWYDVWNQDWSKGATYGRHRQAFPKQYTDVMAKKKSQILTVQEFLISFKGGQSIFQLKDTSTVGKIDAMCGLVPAADISGTTTDTIAFIQRFFGMMFLGEFDKLFFMLPLATIVAGAHHSMLEVALPLSQNKYFSYSVGEYTSLMIPSKDAAAKEIEKSLKAAEDHKYNHLMCVAYDGPKNPKPVGAYVFGDKEKAAYFKMTEATKLIGALQKEDPFPTQAGVKAFLTKQGFKGL